MMQLKSPAFTHEGEIPKKYTCEGENSSPELSWTDAPPNTHSFAITMEDPDAPAGIWSHWIIYNIPKETRHLHARVAPEKHLPDNSLQGRNSFHKTGYGGPCPPPRHGTHRYFFKLYALDTDLDLPPNSNRSALLTAMSGHVLARAELMGHFERGQ